MKTNHKMQIAFWLNAFFAVAEAIGGILTGSVAILSDALHDLGDAAGIGVSLWMERRSGLQADRHYTYGYKRYTVFGGLFTTALLLIGSVTVMMHAAERFWTPNPVNADGMLWIAVAGLLVNGVAAVVTHGGDSLNQRAVNLHMLEDVFGWAAVLLGAVLIRLTGWAWLDPLLSVAVSGWILWKAVVHLREILAVLAERMPDSVDGDTLLDALQSAEGVKDIHHLHVWSLDGIHHIATLHAVTDGETVAVKAALREILHTYGIDHATVETESEEERCLLPCCPTDEESGHHHHHHH